MYSYGMPIYMYGIIYYYMHAHRAEQSDQLVDHDIPPLAVSLSIPSILVARLFKSTSLKACINWCHVAVLHFLNHN